MVSDAFGVSAHAGDVVAYAPGGRGAQNFFLGEVISVTEKSVVIRSKNSVDYKGDPEKHVRQSGCFVIQ